MRIAYFISPHGFGHAARACAAMTAISLHYPEAHFSIFTRVPQWFFERSLSGTANFSYHSLQTDVGFIQTTSMVEDYEGTLTALSEIYPLRESVTREVASTLQKQNVALSICDISVLGIEAATLASIPSVLIETFTWDWIYSGYSDVAPRFQYFIDYLKPLYTRASLRIQTEPVSVREDAAAVIPPLARPLRAAPGEIRKQLVIPEEAPAILCTMGGVPGDFPFLSQLGKHKGIYFILAGTEPSTTLPKNVRAIPHASPLYHPDLVAAADAVVGKLGYSTVAEAYYGRTQFLYLPRPRFSESAIMEEFVSKELNGKAIEAIAFETGAWLADLHHLLESPEEGAISIGESYDQLVDALQVVMP
jgi:hypothetical protein